MSIPPTFSVSLNKVFLVGFFCIFLGYLFLTAGGYFEIGQGDPAQRVLMSFSLYQDLWGHVFNKRTLYEMWPPGYFVVQGLLIKIGKSLGQEVSFLIKEISMLSIVMWAIGVWCFRKSVSVIAGEEAGSWSGLFMLGYPTLLYLTRTTYAEIYCIGIMGGAFWLIALSATRNDHSNLYAFLGAALFFLANTFRHEMAFIAAGVGLYFFLRKDYLKTVIILVVGCSFLGVRIFYSYFFMPNSITFLNNTKLHEGGLASLSTEFKQMMPTSTVTFLGAFLLAAILIKFWSCWKKWIHSKKTLPDFIKINFSQSLTASCKLYGLFIFPMLVLLLFLIYAVLTLNSVGRERFILFPGLFAGLTLATFIGQNLFQHNQPKVNLYPRLRSFLVLSMTGLAVFFLIQTTEKAYHHPAPLREAIEWLNKNNQNKEAINIDYLDWYGQPMMLYTAIDLNLNNQSFIFTYSPHLKSILPENLNNAYTREKGKFVSTAKSHLHIYDYKPRFLVLASDAFYQKFQSQNLAGFFRRDSFIRSYLTQKSPGKLKFTSPYLPDTLDIYLNRVFNNTMINIFELSYEDHTSAGRI
ncbi:MAG: hypothetical protein ACQ9MH_05310 [Nitrospinales bacterium]